MGGAGAVAGAVAGAGTWAGTVVGARAVAGAGVGAVAGAGAGAGAWAGAEAGAVAGAGAGAEVGAGGAGAGAGAVAGAGAGAGAWAVAGAGALGGVRAVAGALALALALLLRWVGAGEPSRPLTRSVTPASPCYSFTYACLVPVFSCSFVFFFYTSAFCLFFVCLFVCLFFLPYRVLASCLFGGCFRRCFCLFLLLLIDSPCHWFVSSAPKSAKMLKMLKMQGQDTRSLHSQAKPSKAKPVMSAPMPEASCAGRHGTAMRAPLGVCPYGAVVLLASLLYDAPCGGLPPATALASALRWCPRRSSLVPSSLYAACATGPIGLRVSSSPRLPTVPSTTASVAPIVWTWILPVVTSASFACDPFVAWSIPGPIAAVAVAGAGARAGAGAGAGAVAGAAAGAGAGAGTGPVA